MLLFTDFLRASYPFLRLAYLFSNAWLHLLGFLILSCFRLSKIKGRDRGRYIGVPRREGRNGTSKVV